LSTKYATFYFTHITTDNSTFEKSYQSTKLSANSKAFCPSYTTTEYAAIRPAIFGTVGEALDSTNINTQFSAICVSFKIPYFDANYTTIFAAER